MIDDYIEYSILRDLVRDDILQIYVVFTTVKLGVRISDHVPINSKKVTIDYLYLRIVM